MSILIRAIVDEWENEGFNSLDEYPDIPEHPEFIYRLEGSWLGWNNFLRVPRDHPEYKINIRRDAIESQAFEIFKQENDISLVLKRSIK